MLEIMSTTEKMQFNSGIFYANFLIFRMQRKMTRCNAATLVLEPISILQISFFFFFFLTEIVDKIMCLQESSNIKMSRRLNQHSSLLNVKNWKLPYSFITLFTVFQSMLYRCISSPF